MELRKPAHRTERKQVLFLPQVCDSHPPELQHHHSEVKETDEPGQVTVKEHRKRMLGKGETLLGALALLGRAQIPCQKARHRAQDSIAMTKHLCL